MHASSPCGQIERQLEIIRIKSIKAFPCQHLNALSERKENKTMMMNLMGMQYKVEGIRKEEMKEI